MTTYTNPYQQQQLPPDMLQQMMLMQMMQQQQQGAQQQQQKKEPSLASKAGSALKDYLKSKAKNAIKDTVKDKLFSSGSTFGNAIDFGAANPGLEAFAAGDFANVPTDLFSGGLDAGGMSIDPLMSSDYGMSTGELAGGGAGNFGSIGSKLIPGAGVVLGGYNAIKGIEKGNPLQAGLGGLGAGMGGAALAGVGSGLTGLSSLAALGPYGLAAGVIMAGLAAANKESPTNLEDKRLESLEKYFDENGLDKSILPGYNAQTGKLDIGHEERGRDKQLEDINKKGVPKDFQGAWDDPSTPQKERIWQNTKWLKSGQEKDLDPFSTQGYAAFVQKALEESGPNTSKLDLQKRQMELAETAQAANAMNEHHGTIDVDWDKVNKFKKENPNYQPGEAWNQFKYDTSLQSVQEQGVPWQQELERRQREEPNWTDWDAVKRELGGHYSGQPQQQAATPMPKPTLQQQPTPMPQPIRQGQAPQLPQGVKPNLWAGAKPAGVATSPIAGAITGNVSPMQDWDQLKQQLVQYGGFRR